MNLTIKVRQFYTHRYIGLRNHFARSMEVSTFLIAFQSFQLFSIILNDNVLNDLDVTADQALPVLRWILAVVRIYPVLNQGSDLDNIILLLDITVFLMVMCVISVMIMILLTSEPLTKLKETDSKAELKPILIQQSKETLSNLFLTAVLTKVKLITSIYIQTYMYLLHITQTYCQFSVIYLLAQQSQLTVWQNSGLVVAILSIIIQLPISLFLHMHNFDFRYISNDFLGKKTNNSNQVIYLYNYVVIIVSIFDVVPELILIVGIILFVMLVIVGYQRLQFQSTHIQYISCLINRSFLIISIQILCFLAFSELKAENFTLCFIIAWSIGYKLQQSIMQKLDNQIHLFDHENIYSFEDRMRYLYYQAKQSFSQISHRLVDFQLYSFAANHLRLCQFNSQRKLVQGLTPKKCFCFDYFPNQFESKKKSWNRLASSEESDHSQDRDSFESPKILKKFIYELIKKHYEEYFIEHPQDSSTDVWFSYIYFVFQVVKQPSKAFYEAINLKYKPQFESLKNLMIIESAVQDAKENFDMMIVKRNLKNQKYNLQKVFEFDQSLDILKQNFMHTLQLYKKWYSLMINEIVNLDNIQDKGHQLLSSMKILKEQIETLFVTNPLSQECDSLMYLFYKYMNINFKRPKELKRDSTLVFKFLNSIENTMFNKESCVVYISLMSPIGTIKRYTKGFKKASGYDDIEIMDQNIRNFMPTALSVHHDMYLSNFIEKGRMNIIMADHRFLLVKQRSGFIVPVVAKIRLENHSTEDFGASALITGSNSMMHYMIINKYGHLEEISNHLFKEIFKKNIKNEDQHFRGADILKLIPQLFIKEYEKNEFDDQDEDSEDGQINVEEIIEAFIIIPRAQDLQQLIWPNKKEMASMSFKKYKDFSQEQSLKYFSQLTQDNQMYSIKFKIMFLRTINMNLRIIEIQSMKLLKTQQKEKALQILRNLKNNKEQQFIGAKIQINNDQQHRFSFDASPHKPLYIEENLDDFIFYEEHSMLKQKASNIQKSLNPEDNLYSQIEMIDDSLKPFVVVTSFTPNVNLASQVSNDLNATQEMAVFAMPQNQSKILDDQISFNSKDSLENDSNSRNNLPQAERHEGSVASSGAYDDQRSKRRMIQDVLLQNEASKSNPSSYLLTKFSILAIVVLYIMNFVYVYFGLQNIKSESLISRVPFQLKLRQNQLISFMYEGINSAKLFNQSLMEQLITDDYQNLLVQFSVLDIFASDDIVELLRSDEDTQIDNITDFYGFMLFYQNALHNRDLEYFARNYYNYQISLKYMDQIFHQRTQLQVTQMSDSILSIFATSEVIIFILLLSIFPLYFTMQKSRIMILEFFTTFSGGQLVSQYQLYAHLIQQFHDNGLLLNDEQDQMAENRSMREVAKTMRPMRSLKVEKTPNIKFNKIKRIVSTTTPFLTIVVALIVLFYLITSAYLIASFLVEEEFTTSFQQYEDNYQSTDNINDYVANLTTMQILIDDHENINELFNSQLLSIADSLSKTYLDQFLQLTQTFTLYNQYDDSNIVTLISSDACSVFTLFPNSTEFAKQFNQTSCLTLPQLKQGLGLTLSNFIQYQRTIYTQIARGQTLQQAQQYVRSINYTSADFSQSIYTQFILEQISQIQISQQQDIISTQITIQIILFAISLIIILTLYYFSERYLGSKLQAVIANTKELLILLPFELLLENAYVMSYIIAEQKKINV